MNLKNDTWKARQIASLTAKAALSMMDRKKLRLLLGRKTFAKLYDSVLEAQARNAAPMSAVTALAMTGNFHAAGVVALHEAERIAENLGIMHPQNVKDKILAQPWTGAMDAFVKQHSQIGME